MTQQNQGFQPYSPKVDDAETLKYYLEKMSRGVSHDVNNVFTYIMGMTELALMEPGIPDSTQVALAKIITYVDRGRHLTQQIMDFGNSFQCHPREVNLDSFLARFRGELKLQTEFEHEVAIKNGTGINNIFVDESLLNKLFYHVCLNAVEAMAESENHTKKLLISAVLIDGDKIEFSIQDTGTGIKEANIDDIFTPFVSGKRSTKNAGLGLTIALQIALIHKGSIEIANNEEGGVTVKIILPVGTPPT